MREITVRIALTCGAAAFFGLVSMFWVGWMYHVFHWIWTQ